MSEFLGLDEYEAQDQQVQHGDELDLSFSRTLRGLGMYVIAGDPLLAGDIRLVTSKGTADNGATPQLTLGGGSGVYFVGLISDQGFKTNYRVFVAVDFVAQVWGFLPNTFQHEDLSQAPPAGIDRMAEMPVE
ncbi:hypothetical protein ACFL59_03720 [Planctomycetota bacterium]